MSTIDLMSDEENEEFESGASGEEESAEESGEYESGEEEEDDDEDNSDEDDDDDDDDDDDLEDRYRNPDGASVREKGEPIFKYFRLKAVQEILVKKPTESFKCLAAYSKYMVIGGTSGSIYLLDVEGKQLLKEMQPHKKTINEVVIDEREENIASCSDDGTVVISSLDAGANTHDMREPVHSVSLCSNFRVKQEFVSSTGFKVIYHAKAKLFFASKSRKAIHPGDGTPIYSLRWRGNLIAWASAVQVCVFDLETQKLIGHFDIELDKRMRCCLCWKDDRTLISSFKQTIMVHVVEERRNAAGIPSKGLRLLKNYDLSDDESGLPNSTVSGISMFTPDKLLVLTHSVPKKNAGLGLMPELHILPIQGEGDDSSESQSKKRAQLIENDKIPIDKHEANQPDDYRLVPMTTESYFYIVAPKDMILVKPRDCDDHITFLILKEKFRKAYNFARRYVNQISQKYTLVSLGEKYMDKLLKAQKFAEVADLCTNVLRNDPELWERWITKFINHNATNYIVQRIPYGQNCPKLSPGTYEMVIQQFIREDELPQRGNSSSSSSSSSSNAGLEEERDPAVILKTIINAWPIDIYSPANIVVPLEELRFKMRSRPLSSGTTYLVALANLYVKMGHFEDAVDVYLEAGDITLAIELTDKHGIFKFISNPQKFFEISPQEGAKFAVSHRMDVDPTSIFKQLSNNQHRYEFLSCLFEKDTKAVPELHNTLLELYIQFDKSRKKLEYFLYTSECYNQQEALRKLEQKKYFREMAHIYGRLSQHKKAIEILINNQEDRPLVGGVQHRSTNVRDAVRFIEKHRVDQLWGDLIDLVVGHPDKKAMISDLLVAISGKVDPLLVINKIPPGTKIDNLNMQLSRIINEYRVQISMREDCNQILQTDNFELMTQINKTKSRGTRVDSSNSCRHCSDPIIFGSNNFVVFWCNHVYHVKCLNELQRGMAKGPQERSSSSSQRDPMEHLKRFKCLTCHPN